MRKEYAEYYAYCEECKAYVKQIKGKWEVQSDA